MHRSVPALAAAMAIGSVLASPGPAAADGPFAPGEIRTIQLPVPETWSAAREVDVTVGTVTQQENGCLDPELKAGDDCLSETGELAGQVTGNVTLGLPDGAACKRGPSADLDLSGAATARLTVATPGVQCMFVELTFRHDALNNRAQSDSLTFGLNLVARELPAVVRPADVPAATDGQVDASAPSDGSTAGGGGTDGGNTAIDTGASGSVDGPTTTSRDVAGRVSAADAADAGAPAAAPAGPVGAEVVEAPEGQVLDRLAAQVSVGDGGVTVQTQAAASSLQGQVLAWGSLLLGAVALGWWTFVVVMRRRRKEVAA